jgi:hypothetical protein
MRGEAARTGEAAGRQWEDFAARGRDADGMFILGGERPVARYRRPAVGKHLHMRFAEIDHWLDGEDHAFADFRPFVRAAVMQDVRRVVEQASDAMAAEIAHHRATLRFRIGLDRRADCAGAHAGLHRRDAAQQAFIGHFHQPLGGALDLADRIHAARIAMPSVQHIGHVDIDDIAFAQRLRIRNAVADDVVDRGADGFGIAAIIQRCRQRAVVGAEFEDETIDGVGRDARLDDCGEFIEAARRQLARLAHPVEVLRGIEADDAGILEGGGGCVDIGDHLGAFCLFTSLFIKQPDAIRPS